MAGAGAAETAAAETEATTFPLRPRAPTSRLTATPGRWTPRGSTRAPRPAPRRRSRRPTPRTRSLRSSSRGSQVSREYFPVFFRFLPLFLLRETKKLTLFSLLSLLSLSLLLSSTSIIQTRRRRVLPPALRGLDGNPGTRLAARLGRRREGADAGHGCVRRSLDADGRRHGRRHARDGAAPRELRRGQRRGPAFAGAGAPPEAFVAQLQQGQGQGREEGEPGRGGLAVAARVGDRPRRCACLFFSSFL